MIRDRWKRAGYSRKIESDIRCSVLASNSENCGADNTDYPELRGKEIPGRTYQCHGTKGTTTNPAIL